MQVKLQANTTKQAILQASKHHGLTTGSRTNLPGVVYLRVSDKTQQVYVGQAKSLERFAKRQKEHARKNNDAYQFTIIGRGNPGRDLDRIEEFFIRVGDGPRNSANPTATLQNTRHQLRDPKYWKAGGVLMAKIVKGGEVFLISLDNTHYAVGQVVAAIDHPTTNRWVWHMAIFDKVFTKEDIKNAALEELHGLPVALIGKFSREAISDGIWEFLGRIHPSSHIPLQCYLRGIPDHEGLYVVDYKGENPRKPSVEEKILLESYNAEMIEWSSGNRLQELAKVYFGYDTDSFLDESDIKQYAPHLEIAVWNLLPDIYKGNSIDTSPGGEERRFNHKERVIVFGD